jgi:hypothetical protein
MRNLTCKHLHVDDLELRVRQGQERGDREKRPPAEAGDIWIWRAIDADTKLTPS